MENQEPELTWSALFVAVLMAASILSAIFATFVGAYPRSADVMAISADNANPSSTGRDAPASETPDSIQ